LTKLLSDTAYGAKAVRVRGELAEKERSMLWKRIGGSNELSMGIVERGGCQRERQVWDIMCGGQASRQAKQRAGARMNTATAFV
jgi:hypothetical protein